MNFTLVNELPELTAAMERLAALAGKQGTTFTTADYGGVRSEADTLAILDYRKNEYEKYASVQRAAGREPVAISKWRPISSYGKSHHNCGAARDIWPLTYKGKVVATGAIPGIAPRQILDRAGFQAAHDLLDNICETDAELKKAVKIGDYFNDEPHVELRIPLDTAKKRYAAHLAIVSLSATVIIVAIIGLSYAVLGMRGASA